MVRIQPNLLAKLDGWRISQDSSFSRPEAIRRLLDTRLFQTAARDFSGHQESCFKSIRDGGLYS